MRLSFAFCKQLDAYVRMFGPFFCVFSCSADVRAEPFYSLEIATGNQPPKKLPVAYHLQADEPICGIPG